MMLNTDMALILVKSRIGISSNVRDTYLTAIIDGIIKEMESVKGMNLDIENQEHHLMFVVDLATWRYQNRDSAGDMPRHLQYRLRELYVHGGGSS